MYDPASHDHHMVRQGCPPWLQRLPVSAQQQARHGVGMPQYVEFIRDHDSRRSTSRLGTTRPYPGDDVSRRAWIDAAQRVLAGERDGLVCPVNGDSYLLVDWVPFETAIGGEFRLACPACGEPNFELVRGDDSSRDTKNSPALAEVAAPADTCCSGAPSGLSPASARFGQSSVNNIDEVARSVRVNGWVGDPITNRIGDQNAGYRTAWPEGSPFTGGWDGN